MLPAVTDPRVPLQNGASIQQHLHGLQRPLEGMQRKSRDFERDHPRKRFLSGMARNNRSASVAMFKRDVTLGHGTLNPRAIGKGETDCAIWPEFQDLSVFFGEQ